MYYLVLNAHARDTTKMFFIFVTKQALKSFQRVEIQLIKDYCKDYEKL